MIHMTLQDMNAGRKAAAEFCRQCRLQFPEEVAELFKAYTEWIWQYKCVGAIYQFYCDTTVVHTCDGDSVGAEAAVAGTLSTIRTFPDQVTEFVDIFAEGDEEHGYSFGQCTNFTWRNEGWTPYGPPTGKRLGEGGKTCYSMCECRVEKVEGRWRITEEWLVRSHDAVVAVQTPDAPEENDQ